MKAISRWLDRFCYDHPNFGLSELMKYIAIGNVVVFVLDIFTRGYATWALMFSPSAVLHGQVWRLLSFVFIPVTSFDASRPLTILWFVMGTYFYYFLGTALERRWGTARFNVFYFTGVVLNLILGFVFNSSVSMTYANLSMFYAIASLYPDMQVLLWGIIPLKAKWLAWAELALSAYDMCKFARYGLWAWALMPVVAVVNYLLFFWDDAMAMLGRSRERMAYRTSHQTIQFKKAQKDIQQRKGYLHKCAVCGITDADDPNMEFRYCSKCEGDYAAGQSWTEKIWNSATAPNATAITAIA